MNTTNLLASAAVAAGLLVTFATSTTARIIDWTYTDNSGAIDGSGQLALSGPNGVFGDTVTAMTGEYLRQTIAGLVNNPNAPYYATNFLNDIVYDNNFVPTTPALDYFGLLFTVTSGAQYNLYGVNSPFETYTDAGSAAQVLDAYDVIQNTGTLSVAAPEPSTWAMVALGFVGLGFAAFRKRPSARALV